jgi:hypothetical protein
MSGHNSRFLYDGCTIEQNLKAAVQPCKYRLDVNKYENEQMSIKNAICFTEEQKKIGCKTCDINTKANIEANWTSIGVRTDIESALLAIDKPNTRCVDLKYHPCGPSCNKKYCDKKCPDHVVVNTIVCDRYIVPTNNVMPTSNGF